MSHKPEPLTRRFAPPSPQGEGLTRELTIAREIAFAAGSLVLRHFGRVKVERKAENEPVTVADRESSALIVEALARAFPADAIISEEGPHDIAGCQNASRLWLIDPLDGTQDFVRGDAGFAVMIGLVIDGAPRLGVVYQALERRMYLAAAGCGATVETESGSKPLRVSSVSELPQVRLVVSKSHQDDRLDRVRQALSVADELNVGSVGVKMGLIALGERDLYVDPSGKTKLWDSCAPEAILREAGGRVTDLRGLDLRYDLSGLVNRQGIVASNGSVHDAALARLAPFL